MKMRRLLANVTLLGVIAVLAACSSSRDKKPETTDLSNGQCMGIADTLKTLRRGDALPRVVQVMGQPVRSYRVVAPFGKTSDVLEYDVGHTACAKMVLNSPKKLELVFDANGGYVGSGRAAFRTLQAASIVRVKGLPVDIRQFDEQQ